MIPEQLHTFEPLWGCWRIVERIGTGAYGQVFHIVRSDMDEASPAAHAALKWIPIPSSEDEATSLINKGMSAQSVSRYYDALKAAYQSEIDLMGRFRGTSHIVSYEDFFIHERGDGLGYDVFIRMELLENVYAYQQRHPLDVREVLKLGVDVCDALVLCQKQGIMHRDIKLENIFVSPNQDFKLGDFGIAKELDGANSFQTRQVGTDAYMAPEVQRANEYGATIDQYSLGIVLYRLLNELKEPFIPDAVEVITADVEEAARQKRFNGQPLPRPKHCPEDVWKVLAKAVAFMPDDRYQSAREMQDALSALLSKKALGESAIQPSPALPESAQTGPIQQDFQKKSRPQAEKLDRTTVRVMRKQRSKSGPDDVAIAEDGMGSTQNPARGKLLAWAAACLGTALLLAVALLMSNIDRDGLRAVAQTPTSITLAWNGANSGAYAAQYRPLGNRKVLTAELSADGTLENLAPNTAYEISIVPPGGQPSKAIEAKTATAEVIHLPSPIFNGSALYQYAAARGANRTASELINSRIATRMEEPIFNLRSVDTAAQTTNYLLTLNFIADGAPPSEPSTGILVMRLEKGGQYQSALSFAWPQNLRNFSLMADLTSLIEEAWADRGEWVAQKAELSAYIDGMLLDVIDAEIVIPGGE